MLNLQASTLSPGADAVRSAIVRIEHREPMVRLQGSFVFNDDQKFEFTQEREGQAFQARCRSRRVFVSVA